MSTRSLRRVAVIGGVRTPFCRSYTLYADLTNLQLLVAALDGVADRFGLAGAHVDEVVAGAVTSHSRDFNLAREAVIGSKLAPSTPGITMMQACGTGLQGALMIGAKIASGQIECGIAAGTDTVSDAAIVFRRRFAKRLLAASRARSLPQRVGAFRGLRLRELAPEAPSVNEPRTGLSMGQHCELMAKEWRISREQQDQLAYESHVKAAKAYEEGFHDDLITPCNGVFRDNNIRADTTPERLAELRTVFDKSARGTLTAGNSTPLTDGASAVLLASETWARARGLPVAAWLVDAQTSANDFVAGDGLLMAPTVAVARLLERNGLTLQDFVRYEIHEAFAAQVLCTLKAFEDAAYCRKVLGVDRALGGIDPGRLNVKGSSVAYGHPFAATGGRILAVMAKLLHERGEGRGLISICTAGGMGVAAILEASEGVVD
jgi:acetyl-CoA C-acetyltransferase